MAPQRNFYYPHSSNLNKIIILLITIILALGTRYLFEIPHTITMANLTEINRKHYE
jgi:hypothetical protein